MEQQIPEIPVQPKESVQSIWKTSVLMKKKFNLNVVLPVLGAVLLIGAGVYTFKLFGGPKACSSEAMICPDGSEVGRVGPSCEFAPCPQSTEVPSTDETANWETYVDNKFSFQYPSLWLITDKLLHIGGDNLDVAIESRTGDELVVLSQTEGFGSSSDEDLESILIKVEGVSGEKRVSSDLITVRVNKEGMEYLISYKFDGRQKEVKEIVFDQILSTFKFTDSNPEGQSIEADGEQIGFIKKVYFQSGQPSVDIDYVEWLSETEGEKACIEDKECPVDCASHCLPNGYYIRNNNPEIRNLILDESANIEMLDEFGGPENKIVNFDTFQKETSENITKYEGKYYLFWVTITNGKIVEMTEQYRP